MYLSQSSWGVRLVLTRSSQQPLQTEAAGEGKEDLLSQYAIVERSRNASKECKGTTKVQKRKRLESRDIDGFALHLVLDADFLLKVAGMLVQ